MKKTQPALRFLLDWALICVGVLGSLFCLITAFGFPVPPLLWILTPLSALGFCLLFHGKPGKYYALGSLALMLLLFWLLRRELTESFRNLWGQICGRYVLGYDQFRDLLPREETSPGLTGPALLYLAAFETLLASLAVRLWRRSFPAALALLPGIVPCFILIDTPPALLPLLAAVFALLTQAFSQSVRRRAAGEENKAIALAALLSAGLLGLLLLIFPQDSYKPPLSWEDLSRQMERIGRAQNNRGNFNAGLSGNPEEVDLAALGALPNRPTPALFAQSSVGGYFYLRGTSLTEFDGRHWTRGTLRSWDQSALFPYLGTEGGETLTLETVDPEDLLYTTYQMTALPAGGTVVSDAYVENNADSQRYSMRWLPDPGRTTPDPRYDQWVWETCLKLPDETRQGVLAWWAANGGEIRRGRDTEAFAQAVADRVSQCALYSRNPLRMPGDADFCTWFLNDAEEGYCVHFASACAALLRALDIPARYAAGYVSTLAPNARTAVTNLQAHAWVEVWTEGRWVVIEPTPDDATEFTGNIESEGQRPVDDPEASDRPPMTGPEPVSDTMPPWEDETERATRPNRESQPSATEPAQPGGPSSEPRDLTLFWIFLGSVGFVALVLGRRALKLRIWERRIARAKGNQKARFYYRRIRKLHRLGGGEIPEEAVRIANKAAFSQHSLEKEEISFLRQLCDQQACRIAISGFWRKLWYKYVRAVI